MSNRPSSFVVVVDEVSNGLNNLLLWGTKRVEQERQPAAQLRAAGIEPEE